MELFIPLQNSSVAFNYSNTTNISIENDTGAYGLEDEYILQVVAIYANKYFLPVIIVTGFIGNSISCAVFLKTKLRNISTSVYLAALSISDTGFLFCLGFGWLHVIKIDLFDIEGICQLVVYMTFVFSFTSVWYVNAFTLEMYIAVFHPSKAAKICTPKFSRKFVIVMTTFAAVFYSFALFTAKVANDGQGGKCMSTPDDHVVMMVLSILDTFMTLLIPFSMIIFMTAHLLVDISRVYRSTNRQSTESQEMQGEALQISSESQEEQNMATEQSQRQALKAQAKMKQMLVVVVLVFLLLNLPSHAIRVQSFFRSIIELEYSTSKAEFYSQHIVQLLYYSNFAVNFALYSVCAKSFRVALTRLFKSSFKQKTSCIKPYKSRLMKLICSKEQVPDINVQEACEDSINGNSRLVEIHLSEIQFSQIPSFDSQYVCESPPCLLGAGNGMKNV